MIAFSSQPDNEPSARPDNPWLALSPEDSGPSSGHDGAPPREPRPRAGFSQSGITPPPPSERLGLLKVDSGGAFVVGAHGGAGESRLAETLGLDVTATAHRWPLPPAAAAASVVVVARQDALGLRAARRVAREHASGLLPQLTLAGLVLMADIPGRPPRELREAIRVVEGAFPRSWHVPWIPEWRVTEAASPELPGPLVRVRTEVRRALDLPDLTPH